LSTERAPTAGPLVPGRLVAVLLLAACLAGCRQDMHDQPKYRPLRPSSFFPDGRSSRPFVEDTVARGQLPEDTALATGRRDGQYLATLPLPETMALLTRGQERFDIYCSPCHDRVGTGRGMIVQRGFQQPPSFHTDRLRDARDGYLFGVVTEGFGAMPSYAEQIPVEDRWAIVSYIRALQLSQNARASELPPADQGKLR
jgi:mono/diheme cytochrome c family protein